MLLIYSIRERRLKVSDGVGPPSGASVVSGVVKDYAELARLGHVSRARITQIMNLLLLAPEIQEEILFLPKTTTGHDPIKLKHLQAVALERDWGRQREMWARMQYQ